MSISLEEFTKRAQEAEDKLKSLESQIDALAATSFSSKQKQSNDDQKSNYEVIYWPKVKNRGNFVKLVLEEANVPYQTVDDMDEMKAQIRSDRYGTQKPDEGGPFQAMVSYTYNTYKIKIKKYFILFQAPPMIRNGDFLLSQSIVCMGYLSDKFGVRPRSNEDNARAQMMANNASDIITELYEHRGGDKDKLFEYLNGRFQSWLDLFEKPLKSKNLQFYFDNKCTQADLAIFNAMDGIEELFGNDSYKKYVVSTHSYLDKYYQKLKERESIKRLMEKQDGWYSYSPSFGWDKTRNILRGKDEKLTFKSDQVIPDVVDTEPMELLTMEYKVDDNKFILNEMGKILSPIQVQDAPYDLKFNGCDKDKLYTVILTDPDARDRIKHEFREWVHFVKVNVKGSDLTNSGDVVIEYVGSGPPQGSGIHRYTWLVYEQENGKIDVNKCGQKKLGSGGSKGEGRRSWKARKFATDNKLNKLVAGTYYNAEYDDFVPKLYAWLQGKGSYK